MALTTENSAGCIGCIWFVVCRGANVEFYDPFAVIEPYRIWAPNMHGHPLVGTRIWVHECGYPIRNWTRAVGFTTLPLHTSNEHCITVINSRTRLGLIYLPLTKVSPLGSAVVVEDGRPHTRLRVDLTVKQGWRSPDEADWIGPDLFIYLFIHLFIYLFRIKHYNQCTMMWHACIEDVSGGLICKRCSEIGTKPTPRIRSIRIELSSPHTTVSYVNIVRRNSFVSSHFKHLVESCIDWIKHGIIGSWLSLSLSVLMDNNSW